jgi:hypothetical protein
MKTHNIDPINIGRYEVGGCEPVDGITVRALRKILENVDPDDIVITAHTKTDEVAGVNRVGVTKDGAFVIIL